MVVIQATPTQTCLGWTLLAKASLGTTILVQMSLLFLLEVEVTGLASMGASPVPLPSALVPADGSDTRGLGLETLPGRGGVRVRKGSTRPPNIPPELWQSISAKRKKAAILEYERDLAAATVAAVATFVADGAVTAQAAPPESDVPRLPR